MQREEKNKPDKRRPFTLLSERVHAKQTVGSRLKDLGDSLSPLLNIGFLALALFGYFHTVRPVYQKDLLEEQTARMEKDRLALTDQLARLNAQVADAERRMAQERVKADQYKAEALQEENAWRQRLASETDAYLRSANDAKARLTQVQQQAALAASNLSRREVLHKHQDAIIRRCTAAFASSPEALRVVLQECMAVPSALKLPPEDRARLREWTDFYARNITATLEVPKNQSLLYGWAALTRDFPESSICWDGSVKSLSSDQERRCAELRPMVLAIARTGDFAMNISDAASSIVAAVEAGTTIGSIINTATPRVPQAPPLLVIR